MDESRGRAYQSAGGPARPPFDNQILARLPEAAFAAIGPYLEIVDLPVGLCLFEPGDEVGHAFFPLAGVVIAVVLPMRDGKAVEAATIGREGVVGGVVSVGLAVEAMKVVHPGQG